MKMALVYKSICYEADSLLLQIMSLAEKEIRYKIEIEKMMNKGFVNIAKARYIMGSTCVTKMQLPTESSNPIQPVATICRTESNNHSIFHIHRKDTSKKDDKNNSKTDQKIDDDDKENKSINSSEATFKNLLQNDPKALKKSKTAYHVDDKAYRDLNEEMLDEMSTDAESTDSLITDPIRLFGVLVPNTLKEAQVHFKDVVNLVAKCATLQFELQEALKRYNHLLKVKGLIESAAKDIKMNISVTKVYWTPSDSTTISCHAVDEESVEEEEEEEDEEEVPDTYSVQKSIRSVFFVQEEEPEEMEEPGQQLVWSSESNEYCVEDM